MTRAPPEQLALELDFDDDLTWEEWFETLADPAQNPQLRGDHESTTSRHESSISDGRQTRRPFARG